MTHLSPMIFDSDPLPASSTRNSPSRQGTKARVEAMRREIAARMGGFGVEKNMIDSVLGNREGRAKGYLSNEVDMKAKGHYITVSWSKKNLNYP